MLPHLFSRPWLVHQYCCFFNGMFFCSLTQGIDLPWESSHILQNQGQKYVWGCANVMLEDTAPFCRADQGPQYLVPPSPCFQFSWAGFLLSQRTLSALAACAVIGTNSLQGGRERRLAHQWNGGRLWWERRACLDCRTLTAGSRKEGNHCDVASKCINVLRG